ncbi:MAG: hypothetical protein AAF693_20890 [Bacteroidota bacterium]
MKKLLSLLAAVGVMFALSSCGDDDEPIDLGDGDTNDNFQVTSNITGDVTWTKDIVYELSTRVIVEPGASLTIEAGTLIKGQVGDGANATGLIVARGAQIFANGTAAEPIIFTSAADEIEPGEIDSPNLTETNSGLWGGVIILGAAPISDPGNDGTDQIEGIPGDVTLAEYGGTNAEDNSGIIRYVSIRHGGTRLGDGDEINGLTLGGVGSGTVIENIEVVANLDDGIEWFGGSVDVTNALVWAADDDAIDIDQAYSGTITNAIVVAFSGTDHCLEIDGPEGNALGSFTLSNVSAKGVDDEIADFRDGARGTVSGAYFFNFVAPSFDTNGDEEGGTGEGDVELDDDLSSANYLAGDLDFANWQFTLDVAATLDDVIADKADNSTSGLDADIVNFASNVDAGSQTQGADPTVFGWTFTSVNGALSGF